MRILFLLDLVFRSCGVLHIAKGYLCLLIALRGVFLAVCSSVGPCPQTVLCISYCRELSSHYHSRRWISASTSLLTGFPYPTHALLLPCIRAVNMFITVEILPVLSCFCFFLSELPNNVRTTLITCPNILKPSSSGVSKQPTTKEAATDYGSNEDWKPARCC